jgi:hypothetical protein
VDTFFFLYLERLISRPRLKSAVLAGVFFGTVCLGNVVLLLYDSDCSSILCCLSNQLEATAEGLEAPAKAGSLFLSALL